VDHEVDVSFQQETRHSCHCGCWLDWAVSEDLDRGCIDDRIRTKIEVEDYRVVDTRGEHLMVQYKLHDMPVLEARFEGESLGTDCRFPRSAVSCWRSEAPHLPTVFSRAMLGRVSPIYDLLRQKVQSTLVLVNGVGVVEGHGPLLHPGSGDEDHEAFPATLAKIRHFDKLNSPRIVDQSRHLREWVSNPRSDQNRRLREWVSNPRSDQNRSAHDQSASFAGDHFLVANNQMSSCSVCRSRG
jgi:hypothetical protein